MSAFTLEEAAIPASLAEDLEGVFVGMAAVRNACEIAGYGRGVHETLLADGGTA
jgi:hypothetical protein